MDIFRAYLADPPRLHKKICEVTLGTLTTQPAEELERANDFLELNQRKVDALVGFKSSAPELWMRIAAIGAVINRPVVKARCPFIPIHYQDPFGSYYALH